MVVVLVVTALRWATVVVAAAIAAVLAAVKVVVSITVVVELVAVLVAAIIDTVILLQKDVYEGDKRNEYWFIWLSLPH